MSWWSELSLQLQFFYLVGTLALLVTLVQTALALLGMGLDGLFDLHTDGSGVGLFSSHTLSAFFMGFGWGGVLFIRSGTPLPLATLAAALCGLGMMAAMFFLLRSLLKLQSSGNLDYSKAVGSDATVYVTLPGDGLDGGGQIELQLQGRVITAAARSTAPGRVAPGTRVRITGMAGPTAFLVEPLA